MKNNIKTLKKISEMQHINATITITGFSEDYFGFDSYKKTVNFTPKSAENLIEYLIEEELKDKDKNKDSAEQKEWRILSGHICPKCNTKTLFIHTKSSNLSFVCNTNDEVKCKLCGVSGHWIWENGDFGYIEFD